MTDNSSDSQENPKNERKISVPDNMKEKEEPESVTVKEIYSVIESYFPNNQFDELFVKLYFKYDIFR